MEIVAKEKDVVMLSKRVGQFAVTTALIEQAPEAVLQMFKDVIVLQADITADGSIIKYMGMSKHFRVLILEATVPEYDCKFTKHKDGAMTLEWVERTSKIIEVGRA